MIKKNLVKLLSCFCASLLVLTACSTNKGNSSAADTNSAETTASAESSVAASDEKISIVTTIFPEYDWVREIIGEHADKFDIELIMDKGADLHSYQASAEDIAKISSADLFVYVGGESDVWVDDALGNAVNKDMKVVNLLKTLGDAAKTEEVVEGMEAHEHSHEGDDHDHSHEGDDHDHSHEGEGEAHDHDHAHEHGEVLDEHVWLSLKNSISLINHISEQIQLIDPENAVDYKKNAETYTAKLEELDKKYEEAVASAAINYILVGDRFPFRYLVDDYNLDYSAAFVGCSAETEASFETVTYLSAKIDELGLKNVLTIENSDQKLANTIISNTKSKDQKIEVLNSLQSVSKEDIDKGVSYLSVMEDNLEVLKKVLSN